MSLGMAEKCSVPAVTDLMFSQFLHKFNLSWRNECCTGSFRCADIVYPEYASKGLKYLFKSCLDGLSPSHCSCPYCPKSSYYTSESLELRGGNSWEETGLRKMPPPAPVLCKRRLQGWGLSCGKLVTLYLHK